MRVMCNDFWKGSKLCVEVVCVVVFVRWNWKCSMAHVHNTVSLNVDLFHLLLA